MVVRKTYRGEGSVRSRREGFSVYTPKGRGGEGGGEGGRGEDEFRRALCLVEEEDDIKGMRELRR